MKKAYAILYMFLVTFCFTSLVSAVKYINEGRIDRNREIKQQKVILGVLNIQTGENRSDREIVELFQRRVRTAQVEGEKIHFGYRQDGKTIQGYAFAVTGPGFWGPIYGVAAVGPDASEIIGIAFTKHSETPGLGGRITEKWFTEQFKGLRLQPDREGGPLFSLVAEGKDKSGNDLDAITGATMTSQAVSRFLNKDLQHFQKEIRPSLLQ
jgi:Na+-transporting NADH:ubiquinone oxidoreductase subunit C